jgi:hypothetical protein
VAEEHLATTFLRARLQELLDLAGLPPGPPILVTTPPGERHEIGAMLAAYALRRRGLPALYLGPDIPLPDLRSLAERLGDEAVDGEGGGEEALEAWWEGVERAYAGRPRENWERGLTWALERWPIPFEAFAHMKEGFLTDLGPVRLKTEEELFTYCYRVAGTVGRMMAPIAGGPSRPRPRPRPSAWARPCSSPTSCGTWGRTWPGTGSTCPWTCWRPMG